MSVEQALADAAAEMGLASSRIGSELDEVRDARTLLLATQAKVHRNFWVNSLGSNGVDVAGTEAEPLQTIEEAIKRTPGGGSCRIILQNAQTMTDRIVSDVRSIIIESADFATFTAIGFTSQATSDPASLAGIHFRGPGVLIGRRVRFSMPSADLTGRTANQKTAITASASLDLSLFGSRFQADAGGNTCLFNAGGSLRAFHLSLQDGATTYASQTAVGMGGFWNPNIPANTALHNGTTILSNIPNNA